ncbi:MAG: preprotein translocase subunit SecG [Alphaproteobacteria bacterium]|jgi:preprotein translocase subunit SecG
MYQILLVIHVILVLALIGSVLLQRSEGGALGMGGAGGGAGGGLMSGRAQANLLTRATTILATLFMVSSMVLTLIVTHRDGRESIVDQIQSAPLDEAPAEPEGPSVPIAD